jgi:hypothetical protein
MIKFLLLFDLPYIARHAFGFLGNAVFLSFDVSRDGGFGLDRDVIEVAIHQDLDSVDGMQ